MITSYSIHKFVLVRLNITSHKLKELVEKHVKAQYGRDNNFHNICASFSQASHMLNFTCV